MKEFIETYGGIIAAAIIIMLVIIASTPLGQSIISGIQEAVSKLTTALGTTVSP
jgi:uncharacterized membrane protein